MIPLAWLSRIFASVAPIKLKGGNAQKNFNSPAYTECINDACFRVRKPRDIAFNLKVQI